MPDYIAQRDDFTSARKIVEAHDAKEGLEQGLILCLLRTVASPRWLAHKLTDAECEEFMSERRWIEKSRRRNEEQKEI